MKSKTLLAALVASLGAAVIPAAALADDPATAAVKADAAQLSSDVQTAHDGLIADLGAITTAAQQGDRAAVRARVVKARSDRTALFAPIRSDRHQLLADLKAARNANITRADLKPILQPMRQGNLAALEDVLHARHDALAAVKALIKGSKS